MFEKTIKTLKRLNKFLTTISNFILVFFIYWIGVSLSFLAWKISHLRKSEAKKKTYWLKYERESEDYYRQY